MYRKVFLVTVLFVSVLCIPKTNAQFVYPAICTDYLAGQSDEVLNTGNDVRDFSGTTEEMRITVWDGNSPGFAWYDSLNNSYGDCTFDGGANVKDPDVVLYPQGNNMQALMVYEINDNIYYEVWEYSSPNWSNITSSTAITTSGEASNPNIDIQKTNWYSILVYQEGDDIYTRGNFSFGGFYPARFVDNGKSPDVTMNNFTPPLSAKTVIAYIKDNGNTSYLNVTNTTVSNILYTTPTFTINTLNTAIISDGEYFGRPRIAAPNLITSVAEFEIVVEHYNGNSRWFIEGYNDNNTNPEIINSTNNADALTGAYNYEPVVTYTGESIIVNWTYDDSGNGFTSSTKDILSRQLLSGDGTTSSNAPYLEYSTVNRYYQGAQTTPSVAGRYSSANNKLSSFFNADVNEVYYKSRFSDKTQFRLSNISDNSKIYPNPSTHYLYIELGNDIVSTQLEIYNIQGQKIHDTDFFDNFYVIDVSFFSKGLYQLKIIRNNKCILKSFIVQ